MLMLRSARAWAILEAALSPPLGVGRSSAPLARALFLPPADKYAPSARLDPALFAALAASSPALGLALALALAFL